MLRERLLVSAVLIPALLGLFWLDQRMGAFAPILLGLCLLLAVRSCWELADLLRTRAMYPSPVATLAACAVVVSAWSFGSPSTIDPLSRLAPIAMAVTGSVLLLLFVAGIRYRAPGTSMESLGANLIIVCYVGLLLAMTAQLRWVAGHAAGYLTLGSVVICAKFGDIGGYTIGKLFGRRKLVPLLSPGKTIAGGVGALLGGVLGACLWLHFGNRLFDFPPSPLHWAALYGLVIGAVGLIGDLAESLIKRDVGRKDAAAIFPGFGGLLDLLDSVLYAGPIAWALWLILPLKTW